MKTEFEYRPNIEGFSRVFEPTKIHEMLAQPLPSSNEVLNLLQTPRFDLPMLSRLALAGSHEGEVQQIIVDEAVKRREQTWNNKLFLMPPLYISNGDPERGGCLDKCVYCPWHNGNVPKNELKQMTIEEVSDQTQLLLSKGYGDIELVSATEYQLLFGANAAKFVDASKSAGAKNVGVNFFPLPHSSDYRLLKDAGASFAIVWQETYDPEVYQSMHPSGPKSRINYRLNAHDRALHGGFKTVGVAFLGGLTDWRFDALATIRHAQYLQKEYDANIIFGMPRWKDDPTKPIDFTNRTYTDNQYEFVGALYSLAMPDALPWFSTRENFDLSAKAAKGGGCIFTLDCSTEVGGYAEKGYAQFPVYSMPHDEGVTWLQNKGFNPQKHLPW
jgi:2-iminoacetate synthase